MLGNSIVHCLWFLIGQLLVQAGVAHDGGIGPTLAHVLVRAFCLPLLVPSEAMQWWQHEICCLGECVSTFFSISMQYEIFIFLGGNPDGLYDLKCWWISKISSAFIVNRSKPKISWKSNVHFGLRGQGHLAFSSVVLSLDTGSLLIILALNRWEEIHDTLPGY